MPTKTTSPSRSSRAATAAIISAGVYAGLVAIVDSARESLFRLEPCRQVRLFFYIAGAVGHAVHELLEVARELIGIARDAFPGDVKVAWEGISRDPDKLTRYLEEFVYGVPDRAGYVKKQPHLAARLKAKERLSRGVNYGY